MLLLHQREIKGNGLGKDGLKKWSKLQFGLSSNHLSAPFIAWYYLVDDVHYSYVW